jgi:hypothetical protein
VLKSAFKDHEKRFKGMTHFIALLSSTPKLEL